LLEDGNGGAGGTGLLDLLGKTELHIAFPTALEPKRAAPETENRIVNGTPNVNAYSLKPESRS
jgi:hypothetical protein